MSPKEVLVAIRECAAELKRNPTISELRRMKKISFAVIEGRFGRWSTALRAAGLKARGHGFCNTPATLLLDWARLARKLGTLPTASAYRAQGHYGLESFRAKFGFWSSVPRSFHDFVHKEKIESRWKDVLALSAVSARQKSARSQPPQPVPNRRHPDRPVYGPPLLCPGTAHEPVNESGVIYLFGALAERLGFVMLRMQAGCPDCEAMREVGRGQWQRVRIEFEFASRNFKSHGHRPRDCDMIVCWIHDWPACPKQLEVLELRKVVREL